MQHTSIEATRKKIIINNLLFALLFSFLTACGGGNTSDNTTTAPLEKTPSIGQQPAPISVTIMSAPTDLKATLQNNSIQLTWTPSATANSTNINYRVYWTTGASNPEKNSLYNDIYVSKYTYANLINGETYNFRVSAWVNNIESLLSPTVTVVNVLSPKTTEENKGSDVGG